MVKATLSLYLFLTLRLALLQFGLNEGLNQSASILVWIASGLITLRWRIRGVGQCHVAGAIAHDRARNHDHRIGLARLLDSLGYRACGHTSRQTEE